MPLIVPPPPGTLFDPLPWHAYRRELLTVLDRHTDPDIREIVVATIATTDEMIDFIESDEGT